MRAVTSLLSRARARSISWRVSSVIFCPVVTYRGKGRPQLGIFPAQQHRTFISLIRILVAVAVKIIFAQFRPESAVLRPGADLLLERRKLLFHDFLIGEVSQRIGLAPVLGHHGRGAACQRVYASAEQYDGGQR